jgi:xanthine/uracil/vitamin C permease (AzgA family)
MAEPAATLRRSALDGYFKFAENGTTLGRDTMAGVTTFIVMS